MYKTAVVSYHGLSVMDVLKSRWQVVVIKAQIGLVYSLIHYCSLIVFV